jgi:hypothetical protein
MPSEQMPELTSAIESKPGIQWLAQEMRSDAFWRQLPIEIRASLTAAQEAAIRTVAAGTAPKAHAIDYRASLHVPILGNIYVVFLVGRERRNRLRRSLDHALRPGSRFRNSLAGAALLGCLAALVAMGFVLRRLLE